MKDLKLMAVRGGFAKICAQAANFILRVGSLMLLARLLDPKDFGLVAMVTAITGIFELLKDAGLSTVTIQRAVIEDKQISTLFWINIMIGVILASLSISIAPILVAFYHEPRLFWVSIALAAGFVFNAVGVQHSALLQRQMRFTALAVIETFSLMASIAVGIGMGLAGFGYWALVGMAVSLPAVNSSAAWVIVDWIPGKPCHTTELASMLRFGGTITLITIIVYIAYNMEKILLGRFWGAEILGIYGRAYQLSNIPTANINSAIGGVAFSALSRLQDDTDRMKRYFMKSFCLVLSITLPITICCAMFAPDIIMVVLGPKWKDAGIIFRLLTPTILIFAMINPFAWLLFSYGLVWRGLKIALVIAPLTISAYLIGLPYGPKGVAFAFSVAMAVWFVPHIAWCIHGTIISFHDVLSAIGRPMLSGIGAASFAFAVQLLCGQLHSPLFRLVLGCGLLFGAYLWMLLYVMGQRSFYLNLFRSLGLSFSLRNKESAAT